jgi:NarL family two-component system response regulator LiaR
MSEAHTIRIITVDDHEIFRGGIVYAMQKYDDLELVGEARNGEKALQLCDELKPDVVLMDMQMPGMDGIESTRAIKAMYPQVKILALTNFYGRDLVEQAMQAGAVGYLVKGGSAQELAEAIRLTHTGQTVLAQEATQALIQSGKSPVDLGCDLTPRELEVLALLVRGMTNAEIAQQLTISSSTASHHVRSVRSKLGAANRAEAVALALQHGLIESS